jgi:hypothetical protein
MQTKLVVVSLWILNSVALMGQPALTYKLLYSRKSNVQNYFSVSVENWPNTNELKRLICSVVQTQQPGKSDRLVIAIYSKLESFNPTIAENADGSISKWEKEQEKRLSATYAWNMSAPNTSRLGIARNSDGKELSPQRHESFDHEKDCHKP